VKSERNTLKGLDRHLSSSRRRRRRRRRRRSRDRRQENRAASRKGLTCISIRADTRSRWANGAAAQEERTCMAAIYARVHARARAALRIGAGKNMEVGQIVGEPRARLDIATQ